MNLFVNSTSPFSFLVPKFYIAKDRKGEACDSMASGDSCYCLERLRCIPTSGVIMFASLYDRPKPKLRVLVPG